MNKLNGLKSIIYNFISVAITYIISIIMMKLLSMEEYGYYNLFISYITLIAIVVEFGIPNLILKIIPGNTEKISGLINSCIKFLFYIWIMASISIIFMRGFFYKNLSIDGNKSFITIVLIISYVLIETIKAIVRSIYTSLNDYAYTAFYELIISKLLLIVCIVICFILHLNINILLLLNLIASSCIIYYQYYKIYERNYIKIDIKLGNSKIITKKQINYSFYMMMHLLTNSLLFQIDKLMVGKYLTLEEVGVYSFLFSLSQLIGIFSTCISTVTTPQFSILISGCKWNETNELYKDTQLLIACLTIPIMTTCIFFSKDVVSIFGKEFLVGSRTFLFLMAAQFFNGFFGFNGTIINLSKYYKSQLYMKIGFIIIVLLFDIYLIPIYGLDGAAYASAISFIIYNLLKTIIVYYKDGYNPFSKRSVYQIIIFVCISGALKVFSIDMSSMTLIVKFIVLGTITLIQYPMYFLCFGREKVAEYTNGIIRYIKK